VLHKSHLKDRLDIYNLQRRTDATGSADILYCI